MRRHEMGGPEPRRQRQFGAMHRGPRSDRSLPAAIKAFIQAGPAFQRRKAALAACRTDKATGPAPPEHEGGAPRLVGNALWNCESERPWAIGKRPGDRPVAAIHDTIGSGT